jgi:hypothetical protein
MPEPRDAGHSQTAYCYYYRVKFPRTGRDADEIGRMMMTDRGDVDARGGEKDDGGRKRANLVDDSAALLACEATGDDATRPRR